MPNTQETYDIFLSIPEGLTSEFETKVGEVLCAQIFRTYANGKIPKERMVSLRRPRRTLDELVHEIAAETFYYDVIHDYHGGW